MRKYKRGRKRAPEAAISPTPVANSSALRRSPLPSQYNFSPAEASQNPSPQEQSRRHPPPSTSGGHEVRDYPPPQALFQNTDGGQDGTASPVVNSNTHSHPSSQGNNYHDDEQQVLPELQQDSLRALNALLLVPDREQFTTVLSPTPKPNTTWYASSSYAFVNFA